MWGLGNYFYGVGGVFLMDLYKPMCTVNTSVQIQSLDQSRYRSHSPVSHIICSYSQGTQPHLKIHDCFWKIMENNNTLVSSTSTEHQWILHYSRPSFETIHVKIQYTNIFSGYPERSSTKDKSSQLVVLIQAGRI